MQLDLQAHRQAILQNPLGELPRGQLLVARGEQHHAAAIERELTLQGVRARGALTEALEDLSLAIGVSL